MKATIISLLSVTLSLCSMFSLPSEAFEVEAISMPSEDIVLSFMMTGRVAGVQVKQGDVVERGTVLATLENQAEIIKVEELKAYAENKTRIAMASAELNQKKVDLKKLKSAHKKGVVTKWELEHAGLNTRIAELSLQAARLEHEQDKRRYGQALRQLDRMQLASPIFGHVEKIMVSPGESVKSLDPVVQIIQTTPLWIDVPVPLSQVKALANGQYLPVRFKSDEAGQSFDGKIIYISSVVDAASDTFLVRLEVSNQANHKAGERVLVKISDDEPIEAPAKAPEPEIENLSIQAPDQDQ